MSSYQYKRIRDLREDHGLSQQQVAQILGIHRTTYAHYERGDRDIPLYTAVHLTKLYHVSLDYLAECLEDNGEESSLAPSYCRKSMPINAMIQQSSDRQNLG